MSNPSDLLVQTDVGFLFPVVDLIRRIYRRYLLKCRFPCETGRSQAPRRQQGGEDILEDVGSAGDDGGVDTEATRTDEGMALVGPHLEDRFVHWSSGPATNTIEIREINWTTHFLPKIDLAAKAADATHFSQGVAEYPIRSDTSSPHVRLITQDGQRYDKYDFQQFRRVFRHNLDDLLDTLIKAQTSMELRLVRDMNANTTLSSQMVEFIDCLKELGAAKKRESSKKRRLL
ncbi:hypothetical protein F511_16563 [Dorcoceras hygrometricum]|uniref:Uncharacterized protein n=1 Tax=Dorcoceras hygrometricum TaxID=472368 RepID=A0A2Z7B1A1_9LAMI|nr:hypothetical protein F511_16563 [Dorcoceras hygrometricum]